MAGVNPDSSVIAGTKPLTSMLRNAYVESSSCILCGVSVYMVRRPTRRPERSWLGEFRIGGYTLGAGQSRAFVSGVGCRGKGGIIKWVAPSDPAVRWDDSYLFPAWNELLTVHQNLAADSCGYVFHDPCWRLLQRVFQPGEIPLERLLHVCASLPRSYQKFSVSRGYDYGGLGILGNQDYYPWENYIMGALSYRDLGSHLYAKEDPYNVPEIPELLAMRLEHPSEWVPKTQRHDCFSRLPWEILETMAINLPTSDALRLRRVSKAFLPLLSSNTFWASRFEAGGDRDFVFEGWKSRGTTDWMSVYRLTGHALNSLGLQNRRRIWNLIKPLTTNLIGLRLAEGSETVCKDQKFSDLRWSKVTGNIKDGTTSFRDDTHEGCGLYGAHAAYVPKDILGVGFSISGVGNANYIAGIRLITKKGPDICLGFVSEGKEIIREAMALRGFVVAAGSRGIHALRVASDGSLSDWVGCPDEAPVTERLARYDSIAALEVGFDGYKVVSLGVSGEPSPSLHALEVQGLPLREAALWYPIVPEPELCLNEGSFVGGNPSGTGYQPLFWIHFGGPGGSFLKHVTGVSICSSNLRLCSLEFHYDRTHGPARAYKLGRRNDFISLNIQEFPIDGAGGELIEAIGVRLGPKSIYHYNRPINAAKITTNRKRCFYAGVPLNTPPMEHIAIDPGTTLTGLYASQVGTDSAALRMSVVDKRLKHPGLGITSLGAVSEAINNA